MSAGRRRVEARTPWAARGGYSRAMRVGDQIWVAGTTALGSEGEVVAPGDAGAQTRRALQIVGDALAELGVGLDDVVLTRMYVTDITRSEEVLRAHGEAFADVRPVTSMVEVAALIDPGLLVEVEAVAIVGAGAPAG